jgi:RES domain-containing protein
MLVYRITKKQYANLDGIGGMLVAGRWHDKGYRVVYFSESRSLALLEYLVHFDDYHLLPSDLVIMTLKMPSSTHIIAVDPMELAADWKESVNVTRAIGTKFLKNNEAPVLSVPTAIVPGEYNFVVNPLNQESTAFKIIKTEPFLLDSRIGDFSA